MCNSYSSTTLPLKTWSSTAPVHPAATCLSVVLRTKQCKFSTHAQMLASSTCASPESARAWTLPTMTWLSSPPAKSSSYRTFATRPVLSGTHLTSKESLTCPNQTICRCSVSSPKSSASRMGVAPWWGVSTDAAGSSMSQNSGSGPQGGNRSSKRTKSRLRSRRTVGMTKHGLSPS